jgi:hypothetical protein
MRHRGFESDWDAHYVNAVRGAVEHTFRTCSHKEPREAYLVLAWELQRRGIEPEPSAVYDGALLISRGKMPAILASSGHAGPDPHQDIAR